MSPDTKSISHASADADGHTPRDVWHDMLREWCELTRYMTLGEEHDKAWAAAAEYLATVEPCVLCGTVGTHECTERRKPYARTEGTRQHATESTDAKVDAVDADLMNHRP